jgi:hypothetical protein
LLVQGKSETVEQKWRLGLPFLRTHCVGLDLENKRVWVSDAGFKRGTDKIVIINSRKKNKKIFVIYVNFGELIFCRK